MVVTQQRTYEDQQYLNQSQNLPQQVEVPSGSHRLRFSWSRTNGFMRIVIPELKDLLVSVTQDSGGNKIENYGTWFFKEYAGKTVVTGTDNRSGVIRMEAKAQMNGDILHLWRPDDAPAHPIPAGRHLPKSMYRLCYRRAHYDWRVRDENMPWDHPDALHFVSGYVGDLVGSWFNDPLAHIFHTSEIVLGEDGKAHLIDASLGSA